MYVSVNKPVNEIKFRHVKPRSAKYRKWSNLLCDNSMSFDIETSNGFYRNGNVYKFDKTIGYDKQGNFNPEKASKHWEQFEKVGIMYIWQFAIDDNVFYGRTIKELQEFMNGRVIKNKSYFKSNSKIVGVYNFHKKVIDNLIK